MPNFDVHLFYLRLENTHLLVEFFFEQMLIAAVSLREHIIFGVFRLSRTPFSLL